MHHHADGVAFEPIPYAEFKARVLELYEPPLRARATYRSMAQALELLGGLGVASTAELTTATIARFVQSREGEHPNTTYGHLARIRAACNIAAAEGWARVSPFAVRRRWVRKVTPKAPKVHSRAELARVLELAARDVLRKTGWAQWRARRLHALVATVAYTGIRKNEALHLRVEDVDFESCLLLLVARRDGLLKTDAAAQPVPMPDALAEVLAGWLPHVAEFPAGAAVESDRDYPAAGAVPGNPLAGPPDYVRLHATRDLGWLFGNAYRTGPWIGGGKGYKPCQRLKGLGKRAGVPGLTFQSLRHSWATHAEYFGLTDAQIQRVMRHTNTRTQWHYRHAEAANLRAVVGGIRFGEAAAPVPAVDPQAAAVDAAVVTVPRSEFDALRAEVARLREQSERSAS